MKLLVPILLGLGLSIIAAKSWQARQNPLDRFYFVAGMPDPNFRPESEEEIFTSYILKYERDSLIEKVMISDSSQILKYLRYYPDHDMIVTLSTEKEYPTQTFAPGKSIIKSIDTRTLGVSTTEIPKILTFEKQNYTLYQNDFYLLTMDKELISVLNYINIDTNADHFSRLVTFQGGEWKELNYGHLNNIQPNGSMAGPFFATNSDQLALQGRPENRELIIPSYLKHDSVFHTTVPSNAQLSKYYSAYILINNSRIRLIYFYKDENGEPFYQLLYKEQNRIHLYSFDDSYLNVKNFGDWIAGPSRLKQEKTTYNGKQPGEATWIKNPNKYSLAVSQIIERSMKETRLSGYLGIRNIHDPNVFLEWDTGQGDCEILFVDNDVVYYRKHDEIWSAKVHNNESIVGHERLLKSKLIPAVHFMFKH